MLIKKAFEIENNYHKKYNFDKKINLDYKKYFIDFHWPQDIVQYFRAKFSKNAFLILHN